LHSFAIRLDQRRIHTIQRGAAHQPDHQHGFRSVLVRDMASRQDTQLD
jgi:hypothetical protein